MRERSGTSRLAAAGVTFILTIGASAAVTAATNEAHADTPAAPVLTPVAPRVNADSGPADLALITTYVITTARDGSVLYFDQRAQQIRRVDAASHTISVVAGSGETLGHGPLATDKPARDVPLPVIDGLWTDQADTLYARACSGTNCWSNHDLYRLDANDKRWHLVLSNPDEVHGFRWDEFGVSRQGDVVAVDGDNSVIRRIAAGSDPGSRGVIVAGTSGRVGTTGNGGPGTAATIDPTGPVVVAPSGDILFASDGSGIRRIDPQGIISAVVDQVEPTTAKDGRWNVGSLAFSADGGTVYAEAEGGTGDEIRALSLDGSGLRTVAGPAPRCDSSTERCIYRSIAETSEDGHPVVLNGYGSIQSWPADGSAALRYHRFAGILNDVLGPRSPDGTRLDQAYLAITGGAESPTGSYALAAPDGIHLLSGLTPDSTITTLAPGLVASSLQYVDDGSLFAVVAEPQAHLVRITPSGVVTTILGGGGTTPGDGVAASDVAFSYATTYAVDPSNGTIVFTDNFTTGNAVWQVVAGSTEVSTYADPSTMPAGQPIDLAFAPDHSLLVGYYGALYRLADGSPHLLCHDQCPERQLHQLGNGSIVGSDDENAKTVLGSDGTLEQLAGAAGFFTVTSDGRGLGHAQGAAAGLLAITAPLSVPQPVDPPTVQVTADPSSSITVRVTKGNADQQLRVFAGPQDANGSWSTSPRQYENSSGSGLSSTFVLRHVFTTWPAAAGSLTPSPMRVEVKALEAGDSTHNGIVNAAQVFHVTPHTDSVAPAAPTLRISNGDNSSSLTVGRPTDVDFDRVVVCKTVGVVPATDPHTCDAVGEPTSASTFPEVENQYIDPRVATTFTAFAVDDSGNVSAPVSVTRPAPGLVPGPAVTRVYLRAGTGTERVYWDGGWAAQVRYAPGTTPPATMTDGTLGGQIEDGGGYPDKEGYFTELPVAAGHAVSVSIFTYADSGLRTYRRTSLTIDAGTTSDAATLAASSRVVAGTRPVLRLRLVRNAPLDGRAPLAKQPVQLLSRPVGGSAWTASARSVTAADGTATFAITAPRVSTQYRARITATGPVVQSGIVTTSVVQTMTLHAPKKVARKHVAKISGIVRPVHATTVYLQRYAHKRWRTVATARTVGGAYRFKYRPTVRGKYLLRTLVANERTLVGTHTATRTLKVR